MVLTLPQLILSSQVMNGAQRKQGALRSDYQNLMAEVSMHCN
jgi:hypothetical protein